MKNSRNFFITVESILINEIQFRIIKQKTFRILIDLSMGTDLEKRFEPEPRRCCPGDNEWAYRWWMLSPAWAQNSRIKTFRRMR
jgi:hypothetical protein